MASPSINTKIKMDGEREYKAALGEIKSALNVLKSEMNLTSEEFKDNADSVEALTKKGDVLERTILTQKEKIEQLKQALQSSAETYGEADEHTNRWKTQLNNAQAELVKMERALRENEDALKDAEKAANGPVTAFDKLKKALADTKEQSSGVKGLFANLKEEFSVSDEAARGLGDALTDVAGKFGVQLPECAQKAVQALNGINAGAALAVTGIGLFAAAIIKAEKALVDMTKESARFADDILTMSMTTGQSAEQLQEFSYAAELIDVSLDTLQTSLTKLTNNMQNTMNGTGDAKKAFEQLNISVTDSEGNMRSANDVFYDVIDALGGVQNATERDALAMDIFGRSAQDLNPLIIQGSDTLRDYAEEAHNVGYVLDNEALSALGAVDDGFQRLQTTQDAVKNKMAAEFAPYLTSALEDIRALIEKVGKALVESGAVDAFGSILESAVSLLEPLGSLISTILPALTAALKPVTEAVAMLADAADLLVGLVTFNGEKIGTAMGWNASRGQLSHQQIASGKYTGYRYTESSGWIESGTHTEAELRAEYDASPIGTYEYWKELKGYNASGTDHWRGGRTLLGENGPEMAILPQGTRILTAQESRQVTGGDTYNITIPANSIKEFEDIIRIVKNRRRVSRMEGDWQ